MDTTATPGTTTARTSTTRAALAPAAPPATWRVRWAAIGAAVAVTLGAGGLGLVRATGGEGRDGFVPITPCRLADTRPAPANVGSRSAPLGAGETVPFVVHGVNGDCDVPSTATGVVANVTAVSPSSDTFVTVFPADVERPNSSNLNVVAGEPATPNQVTVRVPVAGSSMGVVNVFNERGQVDLIIDLVGYFTAHDHDDRYYTRPEVDGALGAKADVSDVYTRDQIDALPSSSIVAGGHVTSSGEIDATRPRFGEDWTVARSLSGDLGVYVITIPGVATGCDARPLVLLSAEGPAIAYDSGTSCEPLSGDVELVVKTFVPDVPSATDVAFSFVAYLPGPAQLTP